MQRVDENTYIDDTLVTCAEYQLFIDEMRDQGKYYQLDHWTLYHFPKGQARQPILGVRHSDAMAFCQWLTQRDGGEWQYRLLDQKEADAFPVKSVDISPLAYWLNEGYQFSLIGIEAPKSAKLSLPTDPDEYTQALNQITNLYPSPLDLMLAYDLAVDINPVIALVLKQVLNRSLAFSRFHYLDNFFEFDIKDVVVSLPRNSSNFETLVSNFHIDLPKDYINFAVREIQERIAGRSPAFEGIRLVKYREQP